MGFFLSAMFAGATIVAINDMNYSYYGGVFYEPANGGYQVVAPPIGAVVSSLPPDNVAVEVGGDTYYYYGGAFYFPVSNGYQLVHAPAGAIVTNLPDGCTTINANGITYLQYNGDYYQPVDYNGQPAYEVVDVEGGS
jgi:hypothetical protein